jgi:hypothetical protein
MKLKFGAVFERLRIHQNVPKVSASSAAFSVEQKYRDRDVRGYGMETLTPCHIQFKCEALTQDEAHSVGPSVLDSRGKTRRFDATRYGIACIGTSGVDEGASIGKCIAHDLWKGWAIRNKIDEHKGGSR